MLWCIDENNTTFIADFTGNTNDVKKLHTDDRFLLYMYLIKFAHTNDMLT